MRRVTVRQVSIPSNFANTFLSNLEQCVHT
jgi:hypothetical protein